MLQLRRPRRGTRSASGQRLDAVRTDLCDPALRHRTIGDLAFWWGFVDAGHFSRAFRRSGARGAHPATSVAGSSRSGRARHPI